jgi:hypothetical protein
MSEFLTDKKPADIIREIQSRFPMVESEIKRLEDRKWILRHVKRGGVGAEIGVFRGHFTSLICALAKPRKLYLIDPWTKIGPTFGWVEEYTNFDTLTTEAARTEATARAAEFPDIQTVVIENEYPACKALITEPLDFAYLDASHNYEATLDELNHLQGQMTPDSVILGDDWLPNPISRHHGVFVAVQEFTRNTGWEIIAAGPGGQWAIKRRPVTSPQT